MKAGFSRGRDDESCSYGRPVAIVQILAMLAAGAIGFALHPACAADQPVRIVALGDSLTAGFGLPASAAFPARLEGALRAQGLSVSVVDAGVSGDTASGGLARLDWSVPDGTEAVILELGANDMLRGVPPAVTETALDGIVRRLLDRHVAVLLAGMRSIPNLGLDYVRGFENIYPGIAGKYGVIFYPFFLEGVAGDAALNQYDGLHPTAAGVERIVAGILPKAEELVAQVLKAREAGK